MAPNGQGECRSQKPGGRNGPSEAPRRPMVGPGRCLAGPKGARPLPTDPMGPLGPCRAHRSAPVAGRALTGARTGRFALWGRGPVRPCTCTMRPTQVPELPLAGPHAPRRPTRPLGWARGGCFGLEGARGACFRSTRQIPLFSRIRGPGRPISVATVAMDRPRACTIRPIHRPHVHSAARHCPRGPPGPLQWGSGA